MHVASSCALECQSCGSHPSDVRATPSSSSKHVPCECCCCSATTCSASHGQTLKVSQSRGRFGDLLLCRWCSSASFAGIRPSAWFTAEGEAVMKVSNLQLWGHWCSVGTQWITGKRRGSLEGVLVWTKIPEKSWRIYLRTTMWHRLPNMLETRTCLVRYLFRN